MTWEPAKSRWRKMYGGKVYTVTCRTLGTPDTRERSYAEANEWWRTKQAELDSRVPPHRYQRYLDEIERRKQWAIENNPASVKGLDRIAEKIRATPDTTHDAYELFGVVYPEPCYIEGDQVAVTADVWDDRLSRVVTPIQVDRSVGNQIDRYLTEQRIRVDDKQISAGEFTNATRCLHAFRDWLGSGIPVDSIIADKISGYWTHLLARPISVDYKKQNMRFAKAFVAWICEHGMILVPPNLQSRKHKFGGGPRTVETIPPEHVKLLIGQASGQLKLHLLLMANCGMTQKDISDIRPSEVDWKRGRIRRKRSKTDHHENVPVVEYLLWPETFALMDKYGKRTDERALLTTTGKPWVRDEIKPDGKRKKADMIKSNYTHLARRLKSPYAMKQIRKTSATLLSHHDDHARHVQEFLGHSPDTVASIYYTGTLDTNLDKAITYLRTAYGFGVENCDK